MDINVIISTMIQLFLLLILGFALFKAKVFDEYVNKKISSLIVNVSSPLLVISAVTSVESNDSTLVLKMIGGGMIIYIGYIIFAKIVAALLPVPKSDKAVYECMMVFANTGFMGYPVLQSVLGSEAVFYASMIHMPFTFFVYTYGVMCLTKSNNSNDNYHKFHIQQLLSPGLLLCFVAIAIYLFHITLPDTINNTISSIGSLTSPLSMMMIGSSLAVYPLKDSLTDPMSYFFSIIRLIVIPVIVMFGCKLIGLDDYYSSICIITAAMPVGSMVLMLATQYNQNKEVVTKNIVVTTLLSVITIPLIVMFCC